MITNGTVPAKEFEGKLWVLADAYQQLMQAAYTKGVYAEREACAKLMGELTCMGNAKECFEVAATYIRARGQE